MGGERKRGGKGRIATKARVISHAKCPISIQQNEGGGELETEKGESSMMYYFCMRSRASATLPSFE